MFKRIALAAVTAGILVLPAAAAHAAPLPPIAPLKPIQVKWIYGPSGSDGTAEAAGYETTSWDDLTYPGSRLP
ncbi:hypothetical protein [Solirubrobacter soli]|uniref:hypothetical protein n=1 Tax=Solirubrobacter soli TaxID=363832 RepID=UPI0003F9B16A|nr:hypothetical protein [Solirubrobacter soli]